MNNTKLICDVTTKVNEFGGVITSINTVDESTMRFSALVKDDTTNDIVESLESESYVVSNSCLDGHNFIFNAGMKDWSKEVKTKLLSTIALELYSKGQLITGLSWKTKKLIINLQDIIKLKNRLSKHILDAVSYIDGQISVQIGEDEKSIILEVEEF